MTTRRPDISLVWQAIDLYLATAYPKTVPSAVQNKVRTLRLLGAEDFWDADVFERDHPVSTTRYGLRLGNFFYPHMKMSIDARPDARGFLFRADTHDRHCCPAPNTREFDVFCELMDRNQKLAELIEASWAEHGLPTFKTYLKSDLERRMRETQTT
jgi:hypothetical protein